MIYNQTIIQFGLIFHVKFYEFSKWLNVIFITIISAMGIYGNLISIYLFTKTLKSNRRQNFTFYFLLLSVSDLSVLIFHYIDFTFRSWINLTENYSSKFNFVDKCEICCKLIPYFRNFFRTISVYILLAMTIQRFIFFYLPLKRSIVNSPKTIKFTIYSITLFSLILNSGNLITNTLTKHETNGEFYCNINPKFFNLQIIFDFTFVLFSILLPTLFILVFSIFLFTRIKFKMKKFKTKLNQSIRTTYMLVLISKWFIILHLPYFIFWIFLHYQIKKSNFYLKKLEEFSFSANISSSYELSQAYSQQYIQNQNLTLLLKGFLNLFEILFLSNYSMHFLLYLINGPLFKKRHSRLVYNMFQHFIFFLFCKRKR